MSADWKPRWGVGLTLAATVIAAVQLQQAKNDAERAKRDSERAFRESPEGRLQEAVRALMRPHIPTKMPKEQVVQRKAALLRLFYRVLRSLLATKLLVPADFDAWCQVIADIKSRISSWEEHATVVTGRFGCGKSVAVQEALRGLPGTYVHTVENAEWKSSLYEKLHLDGPGMLEELFTRVATELKKDPEALSKVPILVLDIPRETTQGAALGFRCLRLLSYPEA